MLRPFNSIISNVCWLTQVLRMPDIQGRMTELVMEAAPMSREGFEHFVRAEIERWAKVIKDAGIAQQ